MKPLRQETSGIATSGNPSVPACIIDRWKEIDEDDIDSVTEYLRTKPLATKKGGIMEEFEFDFSTFVGARYAVAFCNGTAALHAASFACGLNQNTEVIVPVYSYHGIVTALLQTGTAVRFVDIDPKTLNICPEATRKAINSRTQAILVLHAWGNPADISSLGALAREYGLSLISDASHAHGAQWSGRPIGGLNEETVACFSLGMGKFITGGELGVATTNQEAIRDAMLAFGHHNRIETGTLRTPRFSALPNAIGPKLRPHNLALVLASSQLRRYDQKRAKNIHLNDHLTMRMHDSAGFTAICSYPNARRLYWRFLVRPETEAWGGISVGKITDALKAEGIPVQQNHYLPLLKDYSLWSWPAFQGRVHSEATPNADAIAPDLITLPGWVDLDEGTVDTVAAGFSSVWEKRKALLC